MLSIESRRSGVFPSKRTMSSTFRKPRPRQVLTAFRILGKRSASSAFLTQRPAGLKNLFKETCLTTKLLGDGLSFCICRNYTAENICQSGETRDATQGTRQMSLSFANSRRAPSIIQQFCFARPLKSGCVTPSPRHSALRSISCAHHPLVITPFGSLWPHPASQFPLRPLSFGD